MFARPLMRRQWRLAGAIPASPMVTPMVTPMVIWKRQPG
jgi:hypothetical protein